MASASTTPVETITATSETPGEASPEYAVTDEAKPADTTTNSAATAKVETAKVETQKTEKKVLAQTVEESEISPSRQSRSQSTETDINEMAVDATASGRNSDNVQDDSPPGDAPQRQAKFARPRNVEELLLQSLPERSKFASQNLKNIVCQPVLFDLVPSGRKFLYEPNPEGIATVTVSKAVESACTIQIHEKDLMKIADGDLNPQVLMLSHKAKVWGSAQIATYIFNMIAPVSYN